MTIDELIGKDSYRESLEKIAKTSHKPALKLLDKKEDGKLYISECKNGKFRITDKEVIAKKVGEFCYAEEEYFNPIKKIFPKLNVIEIDTKNLRTWYPNINFDAYYFYSTGMGLNLDGLTRVSGVLYKIKDKKVR